MTALLKSQIQTVEPVAWPARSATISYDNMSRLQSSGTWTYKGGPNLRSRFTNWYDVLPSYTPGRPEKLHLLWSYDATNGVTAMNAINPAMIGGVVNGYYNGTDTRFGAKTLYGVNMFTSSDPCNPQDATRLLGDLADDATQPNTLMGVSSWPTRNAAYSNTIHMDDPVMAAATAAAGGSFFAATDVGCNIHGGYPGQTYSAYLKSRYATDSAYQVDHGNSLNYYGRFKEWLVIQARNFITGPLTTRARSYGMITTGNVSQPWPSENPQTCHCVSDCFDSLIAELPWFLYNHDYNTANYRTNRAAAEVMSTATVLRACFASLAMSFAYFQGVKKRGAFSIYPLSDWFPPFSAGDGSAPTTGTYTEPYKVSAHARATYAWGFAWGFTPVLPAGFYDGLVDVQPTATGFPNYAQYNNANKTLMYGDPTRYMDLFSFVAQHPQVFDDYQAVSTIALMVPVTTSDSPWTSTSANQISTLYWVTNYLRPLIENRVPFIVLPVGGIIRQIPVSTYTITGYSKVVKMNSDGQFTANYTTVPTGSNVTDYTTFFASDLTQYAPVAVSGETDTTRPVLATLRAKADASSLTIHLVNTNNCDYTANSGAGGANPAQANIKATLKTSYIPRKKLASVKLYQPGQSGGIPVKFAVTASGIDIWPSPISDWVIIKLDFV